MIRCFFFQAEDGIRDLVRSRGLGDVYKRQAHCPSRRGCRGAARAPGRCPGRRPATAGGRLPAAAGAPGGAPASPAQHSRSASRGRSRAAWSQPLVQALRHSDRRVRLAAEDLMPLDMRKPSQGLPTKVDLRQWASPVDDQGELGACTGFSIKAARELL